MNSLSIKTSIHLSSELAFSTMLQRSTVVVSVHNLKFRTSSLPAAFTLARRYFQKKNPFEVTLEASPPVPVSCLSVWLHDKRLLSPSADRIQSSRRAPAGARAHWLSLAICGSRLYRTPAEHRSLSWITNSLFFFRICTIFF